MTLCDQMDKTKEIFRRVAGSRSWLNDAEPLKNQDNLLQGLPSDKDGYIISEFLQYADYENYVGSVKNQFRNIFNDLTIEIDENFNLEDYHHVIGKQHLALVNRIKHIETCNFPVDSNVIEDRVSEILGFRVSNFNPITNEKVYHYRIVRPLQPDYNPIHRDTWHPEYAECVNIYMPICGSNEYSSLPLLEGSQFINDNMFERTPGGAMFNDIQFTVPAVTNSKEPFEMIRPNPKKNEIMLFSPYLIHGAASNWNKDKTRISLEMRFWRV